MQSNMLYMDIFKQIGQYLKTDIWRQTSSVRRERGFIHRVWYNALRTLIIVIRGFSSKQLNLTAAGLTSYLVFAIVPMLAMTLAVAKGFGFSDVIEHQLNASFLAETGIVPSIMAMVNRYLDTAQDGLFVGIGIIIMIWAIYQLFMNVEKAFNDIWDVRKSRSLLKQTVNYLSILLAIPILIIVSSGVDVIIQSTLGSFSIFVDIRKWLIRLIQFMIVWGLFLWIFVTVPNTKVRFSAAIIPAILMGTLFQLLQMFSVYIMLLLGRTSIVYGAFGGFMILYMLLQWTSMLLLIGTTMTYAIQNNEDFDYANDIELMSRRYKDFVTLFLLNRIALRFEADEAPYTARKLAEEYKLPMRLVTNLLTRLEDVGLLREVYVENEQERTFQPALDTHRITVGMVTDRIDKQGIESFLQDASPVMTDFWERYQQLCLKRNNVINLPVDEIYTDVA